MRGMHRLLVDTNVLLDGVVASRPQHSEARGLMSAARASGYELWVLASSLKDAYYLLCRHYRDETSARAVISAIRGGTCLAPLTADVVDDALSSDEPDFEDGLVRAAAESLGCVAIVSRDSAAFTRSSSLRVDSAGALDLMARGL